MLKPRSRAGRKPLLTRESTVAAAMRVLERDGLDGVTIRGVAAELGVKSSSLYWHFANKDALLDRLADEVLAGLNVDAVARDDWRDELREGSLRFFRFLLSKRDAGRLRAGRLTTGPNSLRWMERGLALFRRAGLDDRGTAYASHAVNVYIQGFVIFATTPLSALVAGGASKADALRAARRTFAELPIQSFPNIVALAEPLTEGNLEERFLFGLDCLIAGITRRRERA